VTPATNGDPEEAADAESVAPLVGDTPAALRARSRFNRALENFTTEALAGAVRLDPSPLLEVLAERGICPRPLPKEVEIKTQVALRIDSRRHVDAVVWLRSQDARPSQVWIEAKVHAPPSGDQLEVYRDAACADQVRDGVTRSLVWLGPEDPPEDQQKYLTTWVRWQTLADAVVRAGMALRAGAAWYWVDLVAFLKENGMTDDRTYPISAREATVLEDTRRLWLKTRAALLGVNEWGIETITEWPAATYFYTTPGRLKGELRDCLVDHGELLLRHGSMHAVYLKYGVAPYRGEASLVVRVVTNRAKDLALRSTILAALEPVLSATDWTTPGDGSVVAQATARAVNFERQEDAVGWFTDRLAELRRVDFYNLVKRL